jgi:hypothetical protein
MRKPFPRAGEDLEKREKRGIRRKQASTDITFLPFMLQRLDSGVVAEAQRIVTGAGPNDYALDEKSWEGGFEAYPREEKLCISH